MANAEVAQLDTPLAGDQDIFGLDVSVVRFESRLVEEGKHPGYLQRDFNLVVKLQLCVQQDFREGAVLRNLSNDTILRLCAEASHVVEQAWVAQMLL